MKLLAPLLIAALAVLAHVPATHAARPNVVVVMTDDQTYADLRVMPITRRLIGDEGVTFSSAYVSFPLCCPSRATFLTGQYAHNHDVRSTVPPAGGVEKLDARHTLPVWLQRVGYETVHIGKYLNGYGLRRRPSVPPGWDQWYTAVDKSTYQMYGYTLHENGVDVTYGAFDQEDPALYQTDVLGRKAVGVVEAAATDPKPLFLSLDFVAPHGEVSEPGATTTPYLRPAPRHLGRFTWDELPRASFGEDDVSDKPPYVQALRRIGPSTEARITEDYVARRESLLAVDEAIGSLVAALERTGRLANTYLLFTSDNGFFQGEHRITKGKYLAYDASSHVPLLMRGPGIPPGGVSEEPVINADLAPTILQVAGASADITLDGRSLLPFAADPALRTARPVLHEGLIGGSIDRDAGIRRGVTAGRYYGVRTDRFLYVMWRGGGRELYDLWADPYELQSVHNDPAYAAVRRDLQDAVRRLKSCAGPACSAPLQVAGVSRRSARRRR